MPELPEVQTTVDGLNRYVKGLAIKGLWNDYSSAYHAGKDNVNDPAFYEHFKKNVIGATILRSERRAKNILIHLSNGHTIIAHMKMTGHFLYGRYEKVKNQRSGGKYEWRAVGPGPLRDDPFNRHVRMVFILSDGEHLALSDTRRFAKVTIAKSDDLHMSKHVSACGPEPLDDAFDLPKLKERMGRRPNRPIKSVLMDPEIIAGIGNIYSDEILWQAGVHPLRKTADISSRELRTLFLAMKELLKKGIRFGGDSMSDYRNITGTTGNFQKMHNAYRKTGTKCSKKGCRGTITRIKVGGRSAHFCDSHQKT